MKKLKHVPVRKLRHQAKYKLRKELDGYEEEFVDTSISQSGWKGISGLSIQKSSK